MREVRLPFPLLALVVLTRAILAGGIALLLADKLNSQQRKAIGRTMFLIGAVTTLPLGILVLSKRSEKGTTPA